MDLDPSQYSEADRHAVDPPTPGNFIHRLHIGLLREWSIDRLIVAATLSLMLDIGAQVLLHWTDTAEPKVRHRRRGGLALTVIVKAIREMIAAPRGLMDVPARERRGILRFMS